jgi:renal tumor antigen
VLRAQRVGDGRPVAIKCLKSRLESRERAEALREVQALRRLPPHPHVVQLLDVLYDAPTGRLALVFELMDANLYELLVARSRAAAAGGAPRYVPADRVRSMCWQLLRAVEHVHRHGVFHR